MALYIIATPIGNLSDITFRAIETLKLVDFIACEDTRVTSKLLARYVIRKPLISYFQHSKISKIDKIIALLTEGKEVALVTDAGTPGISDPGQALIKAALEAKIEVVPIPGPSAVTTALSISGFPTDEFVFVGFLPHKKGRQTKLKGLAQENRTIVLYESPYRIKKLLSELLEFCGDREVVVARELTKKFEEIYRGKISEVALKINPKGEFTVVIRGQEKSDVSYQHERPHNARKTTNVLDQHEITTNKSLKTTKALLYPELSYKIQGIAQKIRKDYGSGQKESIYQRAFVEELELAKIPFKKEAEISIKSVNTGQTIGKYRPDFVIDDDIVLEVKAVKFLPKNQGNQLFDYLKNSDFELGYIVNFGGNKLYCKRIIYTNDYKLRGNL